MLWFPDLWSSRTLSSIASHNFWLISVSIQSWSLFAQFLPFVSVWLVVLTYLLLGISFSPSSRGIHKFGGWLQSLRLWGLIRGLSLRECEWEHIGEHVIPSLLMVIYIVCVHCLLRLRSMIAVVLLVKDLRAELILSLLVGIHSVISVVNLGSSRLCCPCGISTESGSAEVRVIAQSIFRTFFTEHNVGL